MIKISKKADYAVLVMAALAHRQDAGDEAAALDPVSAQEISEEVGLSRPLVANILKSLTKASLLDSVRGANGGYRLSRSTEAINLAQIVAALEGPLRIVDCAQDQAKSHDCSLSQHCPSRSAMQIVHHRIAALMEDIHLSELLRLSAPARNGASAFPIRS